MRRGIAMFVAASMLVGLTAGMSFSASAYEVDELKVAIWDNNQREGLQQIADEWTEQSGVKVQIDVVDWDNYWTLLEAGAQDQSGMPDVFWMHSNVAQMYMENDILMPLDDFVAADDKIDMANYYEGITELYTRDADGVLFALPKDHDTIALVYNKEIFDKYGVDYPTDDWTWEDVLAAAKAITEAGEEDGVYGYAVNTSNNQDGWYNIVYDYGGNIVSEDHKSSALGSDEAKAGMEMMRQILEYAVPQPVLSESGNNILFESNLVGMITLGSWSIREIYDAENHENYLWAELPYADVNGNGECDEGERWSCYNGLGWAAKSEVEDPEAAYDLISWFCQEEQQREQAELGVTMAGYKGISEEFANAFPGMDVSAFTKIEENGELYFRPYTRKTTVWEDAIQQAGGMLDAWLDPTNPDTMATACENCQTIIEDAIAAE